MLLNCKQCHKNFKYEYKCLQVLKRLSVVPIDFQDGV